MAWDYDYQADGTALDQYGNIRIMEFSAARRGRNREVIWRQGARSSQPKYWRAAEFGIDTVVSWRSAAGTITHVDGEAGHFIENLEGLKSALLKDGGTVKFLRTAPHQGAQYRDIEVLEPIALGFPRNRYQFPAVSPFPFWKANVASQATDTFTGDGTLAVVVGGDQPVPDAVVTIAADTQDVVNANVSIASTGRFLQYSDTLDSGDSVVIDVGARTVTHSTDGAVDAALSVDFADWFVLPVGSYNLDISSDAGTLDYDVTVDWNNAYK